MSILFVDDDADVRDHMEHFLARRVARVYTAQNGVEGISSIKEWHPDLVISDIRMEGMDGLTMCSEIRETMPDLPVIFISAHN
jgi:CheY-like chemotaxis protein